MYAIQICYSEYRKMTVTSYRKHRMKEYTNLTYASIKRLDILINQDYIKLDFTNVSPLFLAVNYRIERNV